MDAIRILTRLILDEAPDWRRKPQTIVPKQTVGGRATQFDEWLSPDVIKVLIDKYAKQNEHLGQLRWKYGKLPSRVWGHYSPQNRELVVNDAKTKDLFKQQVETIVHEIRHWNQHVEQIETQSPDVLARSVPPLHGKIDSMTLSRFFTVPYKYAGIGGYWKNKFEVDARKFASDHLEEAMGAIGRHYGGKIEGGTLDQVIEELMDEYIEAGEKPLTRLQIGNTLRAWDLNTAENMRQAIDKLRDLGVKVA